MACLLCGKEIGPLRLLRDDEFCTSAHRERYHTRLGKALTSIGSPEPPPAPVAGFRMPMPLQEGNRDHAALPYNFDQPDYGTRIPRGFNVHVPGVFGSSLKKMQSASAVDRPGQWSEADWATGAVDDGHFVLQ